MSVFAGCVKHTKSLSHKKNGAFHAPYESRKDGATERRPTRPNELRRRPDRASGQRRDENRTARDSGSDPAQRIESSQVLAEGVSVGPGDLIGPLGAVALGRAVLEAAGVIGAVVERRAEPGQSPLGRGDRRPGDSIGPVGLAGDRDQYDGGRAAEDQVRQRESVRAASRVSAPSRAGGDPMSAGPPPGRPGSARRSGGTARGPSRPPPGRTDTSRIIRPPGPPRRPDPRGRTSRGRGAGSASVAGASASRRPFPVRGLRWPIRSRGGRAGRPVSPIIHS